MISSTPAFVSYMEGRVQKMEQRGWTCQNSGALRRQPYPQYNSYITNDEGARVMLGDTRVYYCGRWKYQCRCGTCDGCCGPDNGCCCNSCFRLNTQLGLHVPTPSFAHPRVFIPFGFF